MLSSGRIQNNFSVEQIHDWREVQLLPSHVELRHVGHPLLVRMRRLKLPCQNVAFKLDARRFGVLWLRSPPRLKFIEEFVKSASEVTSATRISL